MSPSLSLAAYRALSWRGAAPNLTQPPPRPVGQLMWAHATNAERLRALADLGDRLIAARPDLNLLLTCGTDVTPVDTGFGPTLALTSDHPAAARAFLQHWQPDLCLWTGAQWMPNLITATSDSGIAMILADLGAGDLQPRRRLIPDMTRACLDRFDRIYLRDGAVADPLRRLGLPAAKLSVHVPLRAEANPPPCSDDLLAALTTQLAGRPLWLAAQVVAEEIPDIVAAHHDALALLHRLLMVIVPADPQITPHLAAQLERLGLRYAPWEPGTPVDEAKQVLITDPAHLDLWYRLAPLSFLGGSLVPDPDRPGGRDPLPACALGSAVLHGPHVSRYADTYDRLTADGGARVVRTRSGLASCVAELVSPDKAARMALAGWHVVTEGAGLTDLLIDQIQDALDEQEVSHARP